MAETIRGKHSTDVILWGISLTRVLLWLILHCSQPPGGWILFLETQLLKFMYFDKHCDRSPVHKDSSGYTISKKQEDSENSAF